MSTEQHTKTTSPTPTTEKSLSYAVTGMDCADCARGIERSVARLAGVRTGSVNFGASRLRVELAPDAPADTAGQVQQAVEEAGYGVRLLTPGAAMTGRAETDAHQQVRTSWWRLWMGNRKLVAAGVAGVLLAVAWLLGRLEALGVLPVVARVPSLIELLGWRTERVSLLPLLAYLAAIVLGGAYVARSGYRSLVRGRTLDINLLMTIAVLGAAAINQWAEAAAVVFLFGLGEGLEGLTVDRTHNSLRALVGLSPKVATRKLPDGTERIAVAELRVGDVVVVRPGERIPSDGVVLLGSSTVDQSPITGESLPVEKGAGSDVFAGTINGRGYLEVEVRRLAGDTTLARIIQLVEEAQEQKAPSERFVDSFARYYTPAVLVAAVLVALVPPALGQPFLPWFYRALVLLVVSCPCALVLATPVAIVAAIGNASRNGALIKGGVHLEQAGALRVVAFDKTGTLTQGRPEVTDILTVRGYESEELVALAAVVEERSEHPLAAAVLRRRAHDTDNGSCADHGDHSHDHAEDHVHLYPHDESEAELAAKEISDFEAITGRGARASLDGRTVYVGSPQLFQENGVDLSDLRDTILRWQEEGKTVLLAGDEREAYGAIAVADPLRPGAREAIGQLREAGITQVVMLTGDNERTARSVAQGLGVDGYRAELLPEQKVEEMRALLYEHRKVAMVGDGVNDAPALATATVGVAMGAAGSDTALETADIALMGDDLSRLPFVMGLSRRALGIIKANIAFALLVKAVVIGLTLVGITNLWLAILADTGATLLVILNGMRLLRHGAPGPRAGRNQDDRSTEDQPV